jgi:hypothetical protein
MFFATLLISGRNWFAPAAILFVIALGVLVWGYQRASTARWVQVGCLALKLLGFVALLLCLLEPLWSGQRARPGANYFAILADNSQGMQIRDQGATRSRADLLREALTTEKGGWQGKLEEDFQVRRYSFDSRLQFTKDFGEMAFDGRATSMGTALKTLANRYRGQPLAGILLLTDGNATDLPQGLSQLPNLPPVYPVVIGDSAPVTDIALQKVTVAQTAFEDAPVSIQADVTSAGFSGSDIVAQLIELAPATNRGLSTPSTANARVTNNTADGSSGRSSTGLTAAGTPPVLPGERIISEQTQPARRDAEPLAFRFQIKPEKSGL